MNERKKDDGKDATTFTWMTDHEFDELEISLNGLLQKPGLLVVRKRY